MVVQTGDISTAVLGVSVMPGGRARLHGLINPNLHNPFPLQSALEPSDDTAASLQHAKRIHQ